MSSDVLLVEVYCKTEGVVVGRFRTACKLDERAMRDTQRRDPNRYPVQIRDGDLLLCGHCRSPLVFRDASGGEFPAVPGSAEVGVDPVEERRRTENAREEALREERERQVNERAKEARRGQD